MESGTGQAEKVAKAGVKREAGYLYWVDEQGDVSRARIVRKSKKGGNPEKVAKIRVKKEKGYLYFLDPEGDISRVRMATKHR